MKNKEFEILKVVRSIRDKNYEQTKDMTRNELLEWYRKRGKSAQEEFKKGSKSSEISNQ